MIKEMENIMQDSEYMINKLAMADEDVVSRSDKKRLMKELKAALKQDDDSNKEVSISSKTLQEILHYLENV